MTQEEFYAKLNEIQCGDIAELLCRKLEAEPNRELRETSPDYEAALCAIFRQELEQQIR